MNETHYVSLPIGLIDAVSDAHDQGDVLDIAARWMPRILDVTRGSIAVFEDDLLRIVSFGKEDLEEGFAFEAQGKLAERAVEERRAQISHNLSADPCPVHIRLAGMGLRSLLISPLLTGADCLGTLHAMHSEPNHFTSKDARMLNAIARWIASHLRMQSQVERLRVQGLTDPLTSIPNRRAFIEAAQAELRGLSQGLRKPGALLLLDFDHFKSVNDRFGHAAGDAVLTTMADRMAAELAPGDTLARVGGEEFALLAAGLGPNKAMALAEAIRARVASYPIIHEKNEIPCTVSIGMTCLSPSDRTIDAALARADRALYAAKAAGRNRVVAELDGCQEATACIASTEAESARRRTFRAS
ncbi:MAG: sensor domain-containing diguanylate cyclase [Pseudomonadota bacterium]